MSGSVLMQFQWRTQRGCCRAVLCPCLGDVKYHIKLVIVVAEALTHVCTCVYSGQCCPENNQYVQQMWESRLSGRVLTKTKGRWACRV